MKKHCRGSLPVLFCLISGLVTLLTTVPCQSGGPACGPCGAPACYPLDCIENQKSRQAAARFWQVFQASEYEQVDDVIAQLTEAHEEDPGQPTLAFLLGACHLWKFQERGRAALPAAAVALDAKLAVHYLQAVKELEPDRRTVDVFLDFAKVDVALVEGDRALLQEGLQGIRKDACQDPAFNGFVQGWVFSAVMSEDDCNYREAIEGYFATIDTCAGFRAPRLFPRLGPVLYGYIALRARKDPVCYNTALAPHNMEATMLGLGDAYVKQGRVETARIAYRSAKRAPSYSNWLYQDELECRLANLDALKVKFRSETAMLDVSEPAMFFQCSFSCTACHATRR